MGVFISSEELSLRIITEAVSEVYMAWLVPKVLEPVRIEWVFTAPASNEKSLSYAAVHQGELYWPPYDFEAIKSHAIGLFKNDLRIFFRQLKFVSFHGCWTRCKHIYYGIRWKHFFTSKAWFGYHSQSFLERLKLFSVAQVWIFTPNRIASALCCIIY